MERIEQALRAIIETLDAEDMGEGPDASEHAKHWQKLHDDGAAALSALEAEAGTAVKVKALEWVKHPVAEAWRADTMLGTYQVWVGVMSPAWQFDGLLGERINELSGTEAEAKAAAQSDYERRIRSALEGGNHAE